VVLASVHVRLAGPGANRRRIKGTRGVASERAERSFAHVVRDRWRSLRLGARDGERLAAACRVGQEISVRWALRNGNTPGNMRRLPIIQAHLLGTPLAVRIAATMLMLAPLGLVLGVFFPLGILNTQVRIR